MERNRNEQLQGRLAARELVLNPMIQHVTMLTSTFNMNILSQTVTEIPVTHNFNLQSMDRKTNGQIQGKKAEGWFTILKHDTAMIFLSWIFAEKYAI